MSITIITAYYNIPSKFSSDFYLIKANNFLSAVETPIVLFTSKEYVEIFKQMRKELPLVVIERPFEELYAWTQYKEKWIEDNKTDIYKYLGQSPELYAIWAQKVFFVNEIVNTNPFNTAFFFWCDIGAFREPSHMSLLRKFPQETKHFIEDKMLFSSVGRLDKRCLINDRGIQIDPSIAKCPRIVGGLWGGSSSACKKWINAYENMLKEYIQRKIHAWQDQSIMLSTILHDSSLANVIMPDPRYRHDVWFYLEYLLSGIGFDYVKDITYYKEPVNVNCLCLICFKPNKIWFDFLSTFTKYDIYVVIDDNSTNYKELYTSYKNINIIQIDNNNCVDNGFKCTSTVTLKKDVTGWDKAVYYFSYINNTYHNVWFFEEDVFFHNEKTLLDIDSKYTDGDLLSNKYGENLLGRNTDWVWHMINIKFPPPYYCAMVCGVRMSKHMLSAIKEYATTHKTLFFLEALFPSICKRHGLKYDTPDELHTVTHRNVFKDTDINTNNLFHPMKDLNKHIYFRTHL